jgi:hypothetical protein
MAKRTDWSRPLPQPIVIPEVMALQTLADVQKLLRHLPDDRRERLTWRYVAAKLDEAAIEGDANDVSIALRMMLMLEGIEWQPKSDACSAMIRAARRSTIGALR